MLLIVKRTVNLCWYLFTRGLALALVAAAVGGFYLYRQFGEELRNRVREQLAANYPHLEISLRSARLVEGEGIRVRDLKIVEPGAEGPHAELISIDEVCLDCTTDWQELLRGQVEVRRMTIRRPTLRLTRRPDGTFSAAKLLPLPRLSVHPPELAIENGTIEIFDPTKNPSGTLTLRDVNLLIRPADVAGPDAGRRRVQGTLSGDHLRQVELEGWIDDQRQTWTVSGSIEGLDVSPELRDALPGPFSARLGVLGGLRGEGTVAFRLAYDAAAAEPLQFAINGRLSRGRMDDAQLPLPLTDVRASVRVNNAGVAVDELVAHSGQATLRMSAHQTGLSPGGPLALEADVRQLELSTSLLKLLPETLQHQWRKYRPSGQIDARVQLVFDGRHWQPELSVRLLNVSFTHEAFPYRLDYGRGTLTLKDDQLQAHLIAYSGSQPVRIDAAVQRPASPQPAGEVLIKADDIPLDKKLLTAMKAPARAVVASLNPRGTADFYVRLWRERPGEPLRKQLVADLNHCSVRYEKFPYPLANIGGRLEMLDDAWTFTGLEGTNDTGRVTGEGYLRPPAEGKEFFLRLVGHNVPLEEELRDALKPNMQRLWNDMKPRGMVDLVVDVHFSGESSKLSVGFNAKPHSETTSIELVHFPYRLEKLQGTLYYRDGRVTLHKMRAEHGAATMSAGGYCEFWPDGQWDLHLENLIVDRLRADRELVQALPERLRQAVSALKPTGPMNLRGAVRFCGGPLPPTGHGRSPAEWADAPVRSQWDLAIELHQGSLDCGVQLQNVYGSVNLKGGCDGQKFYSRGELAIDSLTWRDYQLTQVAGPLWIDDRQVLLGSWVDRRPILPQSVQTHTPRPTPRQLTATLFGGTVFGDVWVTLGREPRFGLQAELLHADLKRCAQEVIAGRQNLRGTVGASLNLRGNGQSLNALAGQGTIRLRRGDVYELPLMIALLKILDFRPPDRTAFSKADIDLRIQGEHVYFDQINFNGDAVSLIGKGEMDFEQNVALTFYTLVGRDEVRVPILREVMGGASRQIMQIHVAGTLQDPVPRTEVLPAVNDVLERFQGDLGNRTGSTGLLPHARRRLPDKQDRKFRLW